MYYLHLKNHQEPFSHLTRIGPRLRGSRGLCCRPVGALTRLDDEVDRLVVVDAVRVEGLVVLEYLAGVDQAKLLHRRAEGLRYGRPEVLHRPLS